MKMQLLAKERNACRSELIAFVIATLLLDCVAKRCSFDLIRKRLRTFEFCCIDNVFARL